MTAALIDRPSPNHDARPEGRAVDMLVLHYTGMPDCAAALARLCDPTAKVSAHYLVDREGRIHRLVSEGRRAWHAGVSSWDGETDINGLSIGIELENPGHEWGYRPFPEPQMAALIVLATDVLARHPIPPARVLGHSDVAPGRKTDPGELFDWLRLAEAGIGLWPETGTTPGPPLFAEGERGSEVAAVRRSLARFGYGIAWDDACDPAMTAVVTAFQRHFRPARVDGRFDADCRARLRRLLLISGREGLS